MFEIDYASLPVEKKFRALFDRKEIGIVYATSRKGAISKIVKKYGETVEFDENSERFEIQKVD